MATGIGGGDFVGGIVSPGFVGKFVGASVGDFVGDTVGTIVPSKLTFLQQIYSDASSVFSTPVTLPEAGFCNCLHCPPIAVGHPGGSELMRSVITP